MRIGIIGSGGAGTCAAYLLDNHHEITLLERKDYLGGNTHTVEVALHGKTYLVDDGAAWFSPSIYPFFDRYQEMAGIKFDWLPLSLTYYDRPNDRVTCMPPVKLRSIAQLVTKKHVLPQLLTLNKVINAAMPLVESHDGSVSNRQFMRGLDVSEAQKEDFLRPFLSGAWGAPHDQIDDFALYPLMKYVAYHKPNSLGYFKWKVMRGGTSAYIRTVHNQLNTTQSHTSTGVAHIASQSDGTVAVRCTDGSLRIFDHLIVACGARDAALMLTETSGLDEARNVLGKFNYYKATLATHSDPRLMPPKRKDWSVVNVIYKGAYADATIWHGWNTGVDLFCSYISPGDEPKHVHHISEWWLPCETPAFFAAQAEVAALQGKGNVWFAGDYTRDIGSHEDAIVSAVRAVLRIDPTNARAAQLSEGLEHLIWGKQTF